MVSDDIALQLGNGADAIGSAGSAP